MSIPKVLFWFLPSLLFFIFFKTFFFCRNLRFVLRLHGYFQQNSFELLFDTHIESTDARNPLDHAVIPNTQESAIVALYHMLHNACIGNKVTHTSLLVCTRRNNKNVLIESPWKMLSLPPYVHISISFVWFQFSKHYARIFLFFFFHFC